MRKKNSEFITKCLSEAGSFKKNRDFTGFITLDNHACWIMVDGIDSSDEKLSSELVASSIIEDFTAKPGFSKGLLKKYIRNAHDILNEFAGKSKLSASVTVIISDYKKIMYAYAGNTRFYHMRKNKIIKKSRDHSIARLMADVGDIHVDMINEHKHRSTLYNFVGQENKLKIETSSKIKLFPDDVLLMGSQGMWENINEKELGDILKGSMEPDEFIENLEYVIKENDSKSLNNYSIVSIFPQKIFNLKETKKKMEAEKPVKKINLAFLKNKIFQKVVIGILVITIGGIAFVIKNNLAKAKAQTQKQEQQKAEVKATVNEADKLLDSGDYEDSLENFEKAKEKYKDNPEKLKEIEAKIKKIKTVMSAENMEAEGDKNFASKNFEGAITQYTNAIVTLNTEKAGDTTALEDKLAKSKEITQILSLEKTGDAALAKQNYDEAGKIFQNLIATTPPDKFPEIVERVKSKMDSVDKVEDAIAIERSALELYKKGKYEMAKSKYNSALSIYESTGIEQKKREVKATINEIEELQIYEETTKEAKALEEAGDVELEKKSYDRAKSKYEEARKKYEETESQKKVTQVTNKIEGIALLKRYDAAKEVEADGDKLFADKKYKKAIEKYENAKGEYNSLKKPEDYNSMEEKIKIAKKKDKFLGIF